MTCRNNARNVGFSADHGCFAPNGGPWRRVIGTAAPGPVRDIDAAIGTRTTLREKLIKIGAKVVRHARRVRFRLAEVAVSSNPFRDILRRINDLRPRPAPA